MCVAPRGRAADDERTPAAAGAKGLEEGASVRVLVATDRPSLGAALTLFLSGNDVEVVGVVGHAADVLVSAAATRPDVVLVDCRLAGEPADELVAGLKVGSCEPSVIVLGTSEDAASLRLSGADGYCAMGDPPDLLLALMREVAAAADST